MTAVMGCGGAGQSPGQAWQVEVVEEQRAQVVELGTRQARVVERSALPAGAREGDVVVDGRLDPELRARLAREVAEQRARLAAPVPPGLDL
jgi:electron transfer flavoprotein alpha/beta subunit